VVTDANGDLIVNPQQSVAICPTSWAVSDPRSDGNFNQLRCAP